MRIDDEGVGIRVIVDHRQGFAWAGSLDEEVIADTLQEARDNAGFATPDEFLGLAEPDGVPAAELDLWNEELEQSREILKNFLETPDKSRSGRAC